MWIKGLCIYKSITQSVFAIKYIIGLLISLSILYKFNEEVRNTVCGNCEENSLLRIFYYFNWLINENKSVIKFLDKNFTKKNLITG